MTFDLTKAIVIATEAHAGQVDKRGEPYILHPLRVMLAMDTDEERIVAVLHDVLEDTSVRANDLRRERMPEYSVLALAALSRREDEPYLESYIKRAGRHSLARKVKIADLRDNLSPERNPDGRFDGLIVTRYQPALEYLLSLEPSHEQPQIARLLPGLPLRLVDLP